LRALHDDSGNGRRDDPLIQQLFAHEVAVLLHKTVRHPLRPEHALSDPLLLAYAHLVILINDNLRPNLFELGSVLDRLDRQSRLQDGQIQLIADSNQLALDLRVILIDQLRRDAEALGDAANAVAFLYDISRLLRLA